MAVVIAIAVLAALTAAGVAYLVRGVLCDLAADAEWRDTDAAWRATGADVTVVLPTDIYQRAARYQLRELR